MTQFEHLFHIMKKPWVIGLYSTLVILAYCFVDQPLAIYFHTLDLRASVPLLQGLTALGKWPIYIVLFSAAGFYFRYVRKNKSMEHNAWLLLACVVLANLAALILKVTLSRARPELLFNSNLFGFFWFKFNDLYWSFPSGHTITVVSVAAGLGVLFPRYFYAVLLCALLVVMTRVFLYFHYLSDVMAGFYLSLLITGFLVTCLKKKRCLLKT